MNTLVGDASGWELHYALAINEVGQIVGTGPLNGRQRGFLLTPVPEPSGLLALICGLGGLAGRMRRKRS